MENLQGKAESLGEGLCRRYDEIAQYRDEMTEGICPMLRHDPEEFENRILLQVIAVGSYFDDLIVDCKAEKGSLDDDPEDVNKAIMLVLLAAKVVGSHLMTVGGSSCLVSSNGPGDNVSKWKLQGERKSARVRFVNSKPLDHSNTYGALEIEQVEDDSVRAQS